MSNQTGEMSNQTGFVLWLTGLSGAGKSTVAAKLVPVLAERGHRVELLDGDEVRTNLCQELGFSREDRDTNIARIGYVAGMLAKHGVVVLVAAISPYRQARDQVRDQVDTFVEVHVAAPLATCAERDVKGLYAKALSGQLPNFTGISDPYEPPLAPEIVLHTETDSIDDSVHQVLTWLEANQLTFPVRVFSRNGDRQAMARDLQDPTGSAMAPGQRSSSTARMPTASRQGSPYERGAES
jgi:adenylylsulfate kinase